MSTPSKVSVPIARVAAACLLFVGSAAWAAPAPAPGPTQIGAIIAAARQRRIRLEHSPAVKVLNTYYLRIAAAVVTHNDPALAKYAARMARFAADRSRPFLRLPATRAQTFCLARLKSESAFVHSFAAFCHLARHTGRSPRAIEFSQITFIWLEKHKKAAWIKPAVVAGQAASGPGPGKLYMYLFNQHLASMTSPLAKANMIEAAIGAANAAIVRASQAPKPVAGHGQPTQDAPLALGYPPRLKQYRRALETLRYDLVINASEGLSVGKLCGAAQIYLANYGTHGIYSAEVFYQTLNSLYLAHRVIPNLPMKQKILAEGQWMKGWYPRMIKTGGPLKAAIQSRWQKWKNAGG